MAALQTLSPDQKAELLLDPSTGALENVTVVKEVLISILKSPDENQLEKFFEKFVEVSKEVSFFFFFFFKEPDYPNWPRPRLCCS